MTDTIKGYDWTSDTQAPVAASDLSMNVTHSVETRYPPMPQAGMIAQFTHAILDGSRPFTFVRSVKTSIKELDLASLLPEGLTVVRQSGARWGIELLAVGENSLVMLDWTREADVDIKVAATSFGIAEGQVNMIASKVPVVKVEADVVPLTTWYMTKDGPAFKSKTIKVQSWDEIRGNYPLADPMDKLMATSEPEGCGKLILWHGPPGTGKTTALRAMARAWKPWCSMHYISDPEHFFDVPAYLMGVTNGDEWRLVVCEDSDEFLQADAKKRAGSGALGRLLNFSDGILGQGSNTLFLLSTNEPLGSLHPAVTRPGRCLANLEFPKFTTAQSVEWVGPEYQKPMHDMTLAELIEHKSDDKRITNDDKKGGFGFGN